MSRIIIVLGAPNDDAGRLLPAAEGRARAALREYQRDPRFSFLLAGGHGAHFNLTARPHWQYVAAFLASQGVPDGAILAGLPSSTTIEDARLCSEYLAPLPGDPLEIKLVTSEFHLTRARLLFERAFAATPALAGRIRLELVAATTSLPPEELVRALRHEADAIARLAG